jgi:hypothetical protein
MNRRDSLKKIVAASGTLLALPAWANGWQPADVISHPSSFTIQAQELLASVADTIIPAGNSIGALSVGVDKFLIKLIDHCYEKDVQENVKTQLIALGSAAQSSYGKSFSLCDQMQREQLLLKLSASEIEEEQDFFKLIKSETIRGFNTSREVMVNYLHYKQVPGHYYGCVDVKA